MATHLTPLLQLEQVSFQSDLSSTAILQQISATVKSGDRIAIMGISGSGKTSLLRLLNRLSSPTEGAIYFNNQNYCTIPAVELRRQITMVSQEAKLLGMTVREAIAYPLKLRHLPEAEIQQRLDHWLKRFNIPPEWLSRSEVQLSSGQRQWVAIARGFVIEPQILLWDEVTATLDLERQENLAQILATVQPNSITVLLATHQLDWAKQYCDRLWHLHQGELVQDQAIQKVNWHELRHQLKAAQQQEMQAWQD